MKEYAVLVYGLSTVVTATITDFVTGLQCGQLELNSSMCPNRLWDTPKLLSSHYWG